MTNEGKHTPGPWRVHEGDNDQHTVYSETQRPEFIASTVKGIDNARLIAAAPALLGALHALVERATDWAAGDFIEYAADEIAGARAAIAQAEGKA